MIRISISSICYQRGVFEADCFQSKPYDGLPIRQLDCAHKDEDGQVHVRNGEAFQLTQWLERGVFQALENEYLHGLTFALCSKHPVTGEDMLLEKYDFKVTYIGDDHRATINGASLDSKSELKAQAKKFLRSLIAFVETLDDLPQDRWITMMLKVIRSGCDSHRLPNIIHLTTKSCLFQISTATMYQMILNPNISDLASKMR